MDRGNATRNSTIDSHLSSYFSIASLSARSKNLPVVGAVAQTHRKSNFTGETGRSFRLSGASPLVRSRDGHGRCENL